MIDPLTADEQIDEWKLSPEFEALPHGDDLLADFDRKNKPSIFDHFDDNFNAIMGSE